MADRRRRAQFWGGLLIGGLAALAAAGCSSDNGNEDAPDAGDAEPDAAEPDADEGELCEGLYCDQVECEGGERTAIAGVVHTPSGDLPLPGVDVWIPNSDPDPIEHGATCERCDERVTGDPVVRTKTNTAGEFLLRDAPAGDAIPLVIQTGKWRRQIEVEVEPCETRRIANEDKTRLPRNESEGTIPRIAVTTGGCDALECLIRKLGVDESEFTPAGEGGQIQLYQGGRGLELPPGVPMGRGVYSTEAEYDMPAAGEAFEPSHNLWIDRERLEGYDIVVNACECQPSTDNKPPQARQALEAYAEAGGRVFLSHWHYVWLENSEGLAAAAEFDPGSAPNLDEEQTALINTNFDDGNELADWLVEVGGSQAGSRGSFPFYEARATVSAVDTEIAEEWISYENPAEAGRARPQYLSFYTPIDHARPCGRVVLSDIHVSSEYAGGDRMGEHYPFPEGCTSSLQSQEKALLYLLFDLGTCVGPEVPPIE